MEDFSHALHCALCELSLQLLNLNSGYIIEVESDIILRL